MQNARAKCSGTLAMCCNGKIDNSHMQLFIVRVISETSTFLNDACPVFADTCLSRACTTRAQSMSIVSFKLSCVCRKSMAISRTFPFVSSMLSRCIARDIQKSYLRSPFNLPRSIRGVYRGNRTRRKRFPEFCWFFKRGTVVDRPSMTDSAINASDRSNKSAVPRHRRFVTLYSQHFPPFFGHFRSERQRKRNEF